MKGTLIYYYTSYNPYYGILMEKNGQNSGSERLKKCTVPVVFLHYLLSKKSTHRLHLFSWSLSSKSEVLDFKVWNKKKKSYIKVPNFWKKIPIFSHTCVISCTKLLSKDNFCSKSWAKHFILVKIASSESSLDSAMPLSSVNERESCWNKKRGNKSY